MHTEADLLLHQPLSENIILCRHIKCALDNCMKKFDAEKLIMTRWLLCELRHFFRACLIAHGVMLVLR